MQHTRPNCATCPFVITERLCRKEDGRSPDSCPTKNQTGLIETSMNEYKKPDILEFAKQSSIQEGEGYGQKERGYDYVKPVKPRIMEIIELAQKLKFKRLGLVFCMGLRKEAKVVEKLLSSKEFEVVSVMCKVGRITKEHIGILKHQQVDIHNIETMCNPILQAFILNEEKTEFNVLLGLCVGHDSLFFKYADAPCTVLAVKDRVFAHNPLAAIYTIDSYYRCLK
jgi:uncharacterized metal-binding protein